MIAGYWETIPKTNQKCFDKAELLPLCISLLYFDRMGSAGVHIVCVALGVLGLIGTIVCCAVPRWRVSSFTGSNIVTAQVMKREEHV